jgi:hypothetical protein
VQWFISIVDGMAVALAWIAIWTLSLRVFGIAAFGRKAEDRVGRRERIKRMGKLRYILIFGMLGFGPAFGLGVTAADFLDHGSQGWIEECGKFGVLLFVLWLVLRGEDVERSLSRSSSVPTRLRTAEVKSPLHSLTKA